MSSARPSDVKICPLCFTPFRLGDAPIGSRRNTAIQLRHNSSDDRLFGSRLIGLNDPSFMGQDPHRLCPNPKCRKHLPVSIDYMSSEIIAIIGSTESGKSLYMTSLIHQLNSQPFLRQAGCDPLVPAEDETSQTYMDNYYQTLYVEHRPLRRTGLASYANNRPLMYQLSNQRVQKTINLVFFDIGGEDVANLQSMTEAYNQYITRASAILLLIDPLELPGLSAQIAQQQGGPAVTIDFRRDPAQLIGRLHILFEQQMGLRPIDPIPIPTALVLSKADLLWNLPSLPPTAALHRESRHQYGFDLGDHYSIHSEVIGLLLDPQARPTLDMAQTKFRDYSFFAVSATGCSTDATGQFPYIKPQRCVDPLLWILWRLGMAQGQ